MEDGLLLNLGLPNSWKYSTQTSHDSVGRVLDLNNLVLCLINSNSNTGAEIVKTYS